MSTWRIVNPALVPPQVAFEAGDEQAAFREFATRDAGAQGLQLVKSDDDGKTWVEVEARAPEAAAPPAERTSALSKEWAEKSEGDPERHRESGKKAK
jgi:hypothetical protein